MVSHVMDLAPDFDGELLTGFPDADELAALDGLLDERVESRRPLAQLIGEAWFAGLRFRVTDDVLVPRSPLAELILDGCAPWLDLSRPARIVDVGTGSGCLAVALAWHWPEVRVDAVDISPDAVEVAADNARRLGVSDRMRCFASDLLDAVGEAQYDLILSNPPYVPVASMARLPEEFRHEPALGLAAGEDGLELVSRLLIQVPAHLNPDGVLIAEVGEARPALEALLPEVPFVWLEFCNGGEGVFLLDHSGCREAAECIESIDSGAPA